ncbi:DNA methyltransferase [Pseudomonas aeruginosa]|nr:DNA methyltransferase [Pseudomonas aeruginosa]
MTGKPTEVMRQLVRICEPGGRILDPFAGSGTTLVAAELEGYAWTGCELTEDYYQVAAGRLRALNSQFTSHV